MILLHIFNILAKFFGFGLILLFLASCSTQMSMVERSLDSRDFVPRQALPDIDILNQYQQHLAAPKKQLLDVDIALQRENILSSGDQLLTQVTLLSRQPERHPSQIHLLVYNPVLTSEIEAERINHSIAKINHLKQTLLEQSTITLDWYNSPPVIPPVFPSVLTRQVSSDLAQFLRQFAQQNITGIGHHFILFIADHSTLTHGDKQNVVDIANILRAQKHTLSVLSFNDSPEVGFLQKLAQNGNGSLAFDSNTFHLKDWLQNEIQQIHAIRISDIKLSIQANNPLFIEQAVSPSTVSSSNHNISHVIPTLVQGQQFATLLKIKSFANTAETIPTIKVDVAFFNPQTERYEHIKKKIGLHYVDTPNDTLAAPNPTISRSLLILDTPKVLQKVIPVIRDNRYYQAIAMLTEQSEKLQTFAKQNGDQELLRDATILNKYTNKLYDFDDSLFQGIKIWNDFDWDTNRYSETFK